MEFKKKKQYGQNFLTNVAIPRRIAAESGIGPEDCVIEIGPGFGILTRELSAIAHKVIAIEIDTELMEILPEKLNGCDNVKVINSDILKTDVKKLIEKPGKRWDGVVDKVIFTIVGAIVAYLLAKGGF